jgi:hypothetical protein
MVRKDFVNENKEHLHRWISTYVHPWRRRKAENSRETEKPYEKPSRTANCPLRQNAAHAREKTPFEKKNPLVVTRRWLVKEYLTFGSRPKVKRNSCEKICAYISPEVDVLPVLDENTEK